MKGGKSIVRKVIFVSEGKNLEMNLFVWLFRWNSIKVFSESLDFIELFIINRNLKWCDDK